MPYYVSDLLPLKLRAVEALDRGMSISFRDLRKRIRNGEFTELINEAGKCPLPAIPDSDWQEITNAILGVLDVNENDEGKHLYINRNGYCLLVAVLLLDVERDAAGFHRPSPQR